MGSYDGCHAAGRCVCLIASLRRAPFNLVLIELILAALNVLRRPCFKNRWVLGLAVKLELQLEVGAFVTRLAV